MGFLTGSPKGSWEPIMTANTTARSYWVNWRFLACAVCLLVSGICATLVILKHEGSRNSRLGNAETQRHEEPPGFVYEDETWRPCIKGIHPAWLLAFRAVAFCVLFSLLVLSAITDGGSIFYYYTQWTVTSITIYFGLGCVLSMCGCYRHHKKASGDKVDNVEGDVEQGTYDAPELPRLSDDSVPEKTSAPPVEDLARQPAGIWGYVFQVTFQINAGAVLLTDCVYWFVLFPFLTMKHFNLNLITVCMHTINAVFLLGDTAFNSLRFPWFRIGYLYLWTFTYVVILWIIHTCVDLWWPYPFLDLSSPFAPLWYFSVALLLIPCYGIFVLIMKLKHHVLSTRFPDSYQWRR